MKKQAKPIVTGSSPARGRAASPGARSARRKLGAGPSHAGFRPAGVALAVAAACMGASNAFGQPAGAQVIQGQAQLQQQGSSLVVTTQNAAGTNRSVINWQSFSVPAGSTTRFDQPNAQSLSINRVTGNDPSAIYGTLSSNGRLVLVNPSGIAVGAGAVVDTAGFTASTLRMSEADALAGRLLFGGDGLGGGPLQVEGRIVARSGDVVLIAPNVQVGSQALVQAPNGATVLAAGQKVELTGRGLEGIVLQVQAPTDQAVNLGTLQGDAVGIFAAQLKHSGLIQATAVSAEGGKVLLRASGDNIVDGQVNAVNGDKGGSVDVLGQRVGLMANASVDASGAAGGGTVRIGGDLHGANPDVQNAQRTYVDATATIRADATRNGDGGQVVVWADDQTQSAGAISARGGAQGGDGGFVEVSGKHKLQFDSSVDTRAPQGKIGTLLLDPDYIDIVSSGGTSSGTNVPFSDYTGGAATTIDNTTIDGATTAVNLQANYDITFSAPVSMVNNNVALSASAGGNIRVNAPITTKGGKLTLSAGDVGASSISSQGGLYVSAALDTTGGGTVATGADITLQSLLSDASGVGVQVSAPLTAGRASINGTATVGTVNIDSSSLLSNGGSIYLKGGSTSLASGPGVLVSNSTLNAGTGSIQITGSTQDPTSYGVQILDTVDLSAGTGTSITGDNQSTVASGGGGVNLGRGGFTSSLTGSGLLSVSGSAVQGDGVDIYGLQLTRTGPITVTGTAPAGYGYGIYAFNSSFDTGGSSASLASLGGDLVLNTSTLSTGGGAVTVASSNIELWHADIWTNSAPVSITGTGGWVDMTRATISTNGGNINITGGGTGIGASDGISIMDNSSVHAFAGDVTISGASQSGRGFYFDASAPPSTINGANVSITGTTSLGSGVAAVSINNELVVGTNSVSISALGGGLQVYNSSISAGMGGMSLGASDGSISIDASSIGANGGSIGIGAPSGGVSLSTSWVSSVDAARAGGAISIQAGQTAPSTTTDGVYIFATPIDAGNGTILIHGTTAANDSVNGTPSWGVNFNGDATLIAGGGGTTVIGTHVGTSLSSNSGGVRLEDGIFSVTGPLAVTGTATDANGTGVFSEWMTMNADSAVSIHGTGGNRGVDLAYPSITTASGGVTVTGSSVWLDSGAINVADSSSISLGASGGTVSVQSSTIATANGDISIMGGDPLSAGTGVWLNATSVQAGTGAINVTGQTSPGVGSGISISSVSSLSGGMVTLASTNGDLSVTSGSSVANTGSGVLDVSASGPGRILVDATSAVRNTGGGDVQLRADLMTLNGLIDAGSARAVLMPFTSPRPISLGGVEDGTKLVLAAADLSNITASNITVGGTAFTGGMIVEAPITAPTRTSLTLITGGQLQLNGLVTSDAGGDAITLAASSLSTSGGSLGVSSGGRWSVFLPNSTDIIGTGSPVSGNDAVWGRAFDGISLSQAGNRYAFAYQPQVAITAAPATKTYDSTDIFPGLTATVTGIPDASVSGNVFNQDTVTVTLNPSIGFKNAGTYAGAIGLQSVGLPSGYGTYSYTAGTATITAAPLTIDAQSDSRTYNGTTGSARIPGVTGTLFGTDSFVSLSQAFASKDVLGTNASTLQVSYAISDGNGGNNYRVTTNTAAGTITPAPLTIDAQTDNRTYDSGTGSGLAPVGVGLFTGDSVVGSQAFTSKNVLGTNASTLQVTGYTVNDGNGGNNYTVTANTAAGTITPASLTIDAQSDSRTYNGGTGSGVAPLVVGTMYGTDSVTGLSQAFTSKNVLGANASTLQVTGYTVNDGNGGNNYSVAALNPATGTITPATLTVRGLTANDKVYDATTTATLGGSATLAGVLANDSVMISAGATGSFADKNVGTAKPVTVNPSGLLSGPDAGNYAVVAPTGLSASITPAPLTVAAIDQNKQQGSLFNFTGAEIVATGLQGGELLTSATLSSIGAPAGAAFGNYPILVGPSVSGTNGFVASNYKVTYKPGTLVVSAIDTPATREVNNQVVTFLNLFVQEFTDPSTDRPQGEPDIVLTDSSCKPQ